MDIEPKLLLINATFFARFGRYLSDVETAILIGSLQKQTYEEIAQSSGYSESYVRRDVGPKLWKVLSSALGEKVSKNNLQAALERRLQLQQCTGESYSAKSWAVKSELKNQDLFTSHQDWGEAIDVSFFYGRQSELATLKQWIVQDQCQLIALLGMGGIGKSACSVKLAQLVETKFEFIIWRSLRNAPPLETLLIDLLAFLSNQQETKADIGRLIHYLRCTRCLIILDNMETILDAQQAGQYRSGYEGYNELLHLLGETKHQSCLILTSREKPSEIASLEGEGLAVRSLRLEGSQEVAFALLQAKRLLGDKAQKQILCERYGNSPLALKIVATSIQELFDGDISEFQKQDTVIFNGIRRLLDQQFERLSPLEQTIMYWLAINREWTTIAELEEDIVGAISKRRILESLEYLNGRSLLEKKASSYTQQPVVMEYVTDRLIELIADELITNKLCLFLSYALTKTTVKDYVRSSQVRLILQPIVELFTRVFSSTLLLKQQIQAITKLLQKPENRLFGYGGGNLINLCRHLQIDLTGYDFSGLTIWHAYLQGVDLHQVSFAGCDLAKSTFTQALSGAVTVTFSPNGEILATGDGTGEIYLWQVFGSKGLTLEIGQPLLTLKAHKAWIWSVTFSPDGQTIASASEDRTLRLWNVKTGESLSILHGHTSMVSSVAFSPDGQTVASGSADLTIRLWNINTSQCFKILYGHNHQVRSVAFSPDGQTIASASDDQTVRLWEVKTGQVLKVFQGHTSQVWTVAFHPNGQILASGSHDQTVKLWELNTGQCLKTLQGHNSMVWSIAFHPNGQILASGGGEPTLRLWDTDTGQCLKILQGHNSMVWSVAFHPNGQTLASSSEDRTVKLWDLHSNQALRTFQGYGNQIWSVAFSPDGQTLASGSTDSLRFWDTDTGQCLKTLQGHSSWVTAVAFSPDRQTLASSSSDQTVRIWALDTSECLKILQGHSSWVTAVAFSPDGQTLASCGFDKTIKIWSVDDGRCISTLQGHTSWVWSTAFSPNGQTLASSDFNNIIRLWHTHDGECLKILQGHTNWIWSVAFSPDGQTLASSSADQSIKLWDISTGQCLKTLQEHTNQVFQVKFSPDNQMLVSCSTDQTIKLWNVSSGQCFATLEGHTNQIRCVAFNANGQIIASGSADNTIKLWDWNSRKCLKTLKADLPYQNMNITSVTGLTQAQKATLKALGAIEQ
jgi:WD40 repeat protein